MGVYIWELHYHDNMLVALVTHLMSLSVLSKKQVVCVVFSERLSEFSCVLEFPMIGLRIYKQFSSKNVFLSMRCHISMY